MKRKRYIKLLMAKGLPRNKATQLALFLNKSGIPYQYLGVDYVHKWPFDKKTYYVQMEVPLLHNGKISTYEGIKKLMPENSSFALKDYIRSNYILEMNNGLIKDEMGRYMAEKGGRSW